MNLYFEAKENQIALYKQKYFVKNHFFSFYLYFCQDIQSFCCFCNTKISEISDMFTE